MTVVDLPAPFTISKKALDMIVDFEGVDHGGWPGGASGCTIGIGYDLGYHTLGQFAQDWKPWLTVNDFHKLRALIGVQGQDARDRVRVLGTVNITRDAAEHVFMNVSIPRAERMTMTAFPKVETMPADASGALVSLVFNRGGRLTDTDPVLQERREMRAIRDAVPDDLLEISVKLRSMKRLWIGKGLDGLVRRREAEAKLVESCIPDSPNYAPPKTAVAGTGTKQ